MTRAVSELVLGLHGPGLVVVPPGVWHGVQNLLNRPSAVVNMPDRAYRYEAPDHWRLPPDTDQIPYRFQVNTVAGPATSRDDL